jgi:hypothetical protein
MSASDIKADGNLQNAYQQIYSGISSVINGYTLNLVQRGVFANGTLCYQFDFVKSFSDFSIVFYFLYDPSASKVLYLQYKNKSPQCPSTASAATAATAAPTAPTATNA